MEDLDDGDFVASEHDRLVNAITKLNKTQHITEPTRNEPTILNSEFNLIKRSTKIDLNKVAKVLEDTANHVKIGKKLKKTQDGSKVLQKPLEKPVVERIKRATGYDETSKRVGRWDPVVARARSDDFQSFPLKSYSASTKPKQTNEFLSKFKLKSQLEKELDEIDPPFVEKVEEEEQVYPMSYEEMVEHRQHAAKIRAQESYKAAKAKRQSKIKSKKYHRILKKEKLKQQLKEFEELQKKDPEEALKQLDSLEKSRALERHTLRHKNTGKWAKSKLIRAKYDKDVRQELAEQLAVSRSLTHKTQDIESTDDEVEGPDTDINLAHDPSNPWMMKQADKSNVDAEFNFGYKKYIEGRMFKKKEETDSDDSSEENDLQADASGIEALKNSIRKIAETDPVSPSDDETKVDESTMLPEQETVKVSHKKVEIKSPKRSKLEKTKQNKSKVKSTKSKKVTATSEWTVEIVQEQEVKKEESSKDIVNAFESFEDDVAGQVEKKLKAIRQQVEELEKRKGKQLKKGKKDKEDFDNLEYLKIKNQKVKPIIDEALIESNSKSADNIQEEKPLSKILKSLNNQQETIKQSVDSNIDPSRFIEVKPKYLNTALPNGGTGFDELDDDEQVVPKVNIEEVFEEDDVVATFMQEKDDEANKDNPEDIDLSLPGWGSWGGKGVKATKRKRNRFILKAPPKMPRRDENKGGVIIKEFRDPKLAAHKVSELPFPFKSVNEYEASIRAPLGNTFIPEKAHKKLIKPSVITKAGSIIEPMDEEELLVPKNRKFRNESVIKLLGNK